MYISAVKRAFKVTSCFITYLAKKMMNQTLLFLAKVPFFLMPHQHTEKIEWKTLLGKISLVTDAVATAALMFCRL